MGYGMWRQKQIEKEGGENDRPKSDVFVKVVRANPTGALVGGGVERKNITNNKFLDKGAHF